MKMNLILSQTNDFCKSNAGKKIFIFLGEIFDILIIIIPIILISIATIDFIKILVSQNNENIKSTTNVLIKKIIISLAIFFVSPIVNLVIGLVDENQENFCMTCFTNPKNTICNTIQENTIPINNINLNDTKCKNYIDKNKCCKEENGPNDAEGIWIWDEDFGCKNTTASIPN